MRTPWTKQEVETVVVELRGRVLDTVSFNSSEEAEGYKRGVRRWAQEKGIIVGVRSHRPHEIWPESAQAAASYV